MTTATANDGRISSGELYTIEDAMRRLGWGIGALRSARRKGLITKRIGKRTYVSGADIIEFVVKTGTVV